MGNGLCDRPLGVLVYKGDGDNDGTVQERTDRCATACLGKRGPLQFGPWSSRGDAVGFAITENNGRCYCQHVSFASCPKKHTAYKAYEFTAGESTRTCSGGGTFLPRAASAPAGGALRPPARTRVYMYTRGRPTVPFPHTLLPYFWRRV